MFPAELRLGVGLASCESSSIYLSCCSARGGQCLLHRDPRPCEKVDSGHAWGPPPQGTLIYWASLVRRHRRGRLRADPELPKGFQGLRNLGNHSTTLVPHPPHSGLKKSPLWSQDFLTSPSAGCPPIRDAWSFQTRSSIPLDRVPCL